MMSLARYGAPFGGLIRRAGPSAGCSGGRTDGTISTARGEQTFGRPGSEGWVRDPAAWGSLESTRGRPQPGSLLGAHSPPAILLTPPQRRMPIVHVDGTRIARPPVATRLVAPPSSSPSSTASGTMVVVVRSRKRSPTFASTCLLY